MRQKKLKVNGPAVMRLYKAVANYVKTNGGEVIVAGGIQIQQWDDDPKKFTIAVKCSGKRPTFEERHNGSE